MERSKIENLYLLKKKIIRLRSYEDKYWKIIRPVILRHKLISVVLSLLFFVFIFHEYELFILNERYSENIRWVLCVIFALSTSLIYLVIGNLFLFKKPMKRLKKDKKLKHLIKEKKEEWEREVLSLTPEDFLEAKLFLMETKDKRFVATILDDFEMRNGFNKDFWDFQRRILLKKSKVGVFSGLISDNVLCEIQQEDYDKQLKKDCIEKRLEEITKKNFIKIENC